MLCISICVHPYSVRPVPVQVGGEFWSGEFWSFGGNCGVFGVDLSPSDVVMS